MVRFEAGMLSLLRIVAGLLFLCHGGQKLLGWFGGMGGEGGPLPPLMVLAGFIELVGGTLILLGLFTHAVAFLCSGEMASAYFIAHFPRGFWPIQNHGDNVVLFCFVFLYLFVRGGGPFSLDGLIWRQKSAET